MLDTKANAVGQTPVSSYDYAVNRIGQWTAVAGTSNYSYWYNAAGELVAADHMSDAALNRAYAYDGIGNRLWENQAHEAIGGLPSGVPSGGQATDYDSNELNQYTAVGAVVQVHDLDGNLTAFGAKSYAWDGGNRMIEASQNGGLIATFSYDYLGRRVRKTVGVGDTFHLYDGWNLIGEYSTATPLQPRRTWTWGLDLSGTLEGAGGVGGLLATLRTQGSASQFYTFDGNGNVSDLLDEQGAVVGHYEYDPFGNVINTLTAAAEQNQFRFSTKFLDAETSFYYYGHRYYNPDAGRWLSRDPIRERGGLNLYAVVKNMAGNAIDFLGLEAMLICNRCRQTGVQRCIRYDDAVGQSSEPFTTNENPDQNRGQIPAGTYDLVPKPNSQMNRRNRDLPPSNVGDGMVTGPGGTEFPEGTPSITGPGRQPGSPAQGWSPSVRVHGPGLSTGCITTTQCRAIQDMMEDNANRGGTTVDITDVDCQCVNGTYELPPDPQQIRRA